jgi:hypothetical protein
MEGGGMGRAYSTNRSEKYTGYYSENLKGADDLKELDTEGITLRWVLEIRV